MQAAYTHENYIHAVRDIAAGLIPESERAVLYETKLVYGAGSSNTRGVTYYQCWRNGHPTDSHPFVEICAFGESDPVQVAGTTIHELGHVLAGMGTGHGANWKAACERLGLRQFQAAGTSYSMDSFAPEIRAAIAALPKPTDGAPSGARAGAGAGFGANGTPLQLMLRPCGAGIGTRGGKSHGAGSGSRLRKFACPCGVIVRASRDVFSATCDLCAGKFAPAVALVRKAAA